MIKLDSLQKNKEFRFFILDLIMLILVIINLFWISFDWLFRSTTIREFLQDYAYPFFKFYSEHIHKDFVLFDMMFVTIFFIELVIRWTVAIRNKTYHSWFYYPFIHWYDALGCIPLGSFRFLRILRIIAIIYRMQKLGIIDLKSTYLYSLFRKYLNILVEEVSDRVVVNVLEGIKEEIQTGSPVAEQIIIKVIKPRQAFLVDWISHRVKKVTSHTYQANKEEIQLYVRQLIIEAMEKNAEVGNIKAIPIMGSVIAETLEKSVADITLKIINESVRDLASDENSKVVEEIANMIFEVVLTIEKDRELNDVIISMVTDSIDVIIAQVNVKQWQVKELKEREKKMQATV